MISGESQGRPFDRTFSQTTGGAVFQKASLVWRRSSVARGAQTTISRDIKLHASVMKFRAWLDRLLFLPSHLFLVSRRIPSAFDRPARHFAFSAEFILRRAARSAPCDLV